MSVPRPVTPLAVQFPPKHVPFSDDEATLRDWFAGQALANNYTQHFIDAEAVAEWAYAIADAMLAERKKKGHR